jgi:NADH-quinone oxidoreductase subunit N
VNTIVTLSIVGIAAMLSEVFKLKRIMYSLVIAGLIVALGFSINDWTNFGSYFNQMVMVDSFSVVFSSLMIVTTLLWMLMSRNYFNSESSMSEHFALIVFALTGGVMMTTFSNMSILFLGLEILSFSLYIMAGSDKTNIKSNEAAMKYFIMGSFATGFLLFGITLIYGATSSFNIQEIANYTQQNKDALPAFFKVGVLMILIGLSFKIAAAPFHFWTPDVYDGAPTLVTAFMASVVKIAAFAMIYRLFVSCFITIYDFWTPVFAVLSAITMLAGNITAVYQTSLKRMLAYSSVAHAGYMLMALAAPGIASKNALLFYLAAYSLSALGAFNLLYSVHKVTGNEGIKAVKGLFYKHPVSAIMLTICMLSMAGIPPVAGFFGKYYLFTAALKENLLWLVLIAILSSLIGIYFYFKVIIAAFQQPETENTGYCERPSDLAVLGICAVLSLLLGIAPQLISGLL